MVGFEPGPAGPAGRFPSPVIAGGLQSARARRCEDRLGRVAAGMLAGHAAAHAEAYREARPSPLPPLPRTHRLCLPPSFARQFFIGDAERRRVMPVLLHGDAAFSGQAPA